MNNENQINSHRYPTDPLESLRNTIVFGAKDWSEHKRDAWIYGIVVGWNDESLSELSKKYRWSEEHAQRLKQLNQAFKRLQQTKGK